MNDPASIATAHDGVLSEQEQAFLRRLARRILDSGLVTPAVFFLEMTKPLALVGSHVLVFLGPIVTAFVNADGYYRASEVLEKPGSVEWLLRAIEQLDERRRAGKLEAPREG